MVDLQSPPLMRQMPLDLGPQSLPGLDEFVLGDNAAVLDCLRRWPEPLFSGPPGAYLWGPSGSGKTHLLRAMMPRALALGHGVIWVNAQGCQMWDAAQEDAPTWALLDDCQRLDGHLQHLAFNLFIEAAGNATAREGGGPLYLLAAGDVPPIDLPVRDDLRTRLGWGLIFALLPLSEEDVRHALQHEAGRRGMALGEEVLSYLLSRHTRDLGHLMDLLDRLDRFALAEHRTVTVPLLKQMLALETA